MVHAVNMGLHYILQHLDKDICEDIDITETYNIDITETYVRILFVDFSFAFNTNIPELLQDRLSQLNVSSCICQWITDFLTNRKL